MIIYKCDGHSYSAGTKCTSEYNHHFPEHWLTINGSIKNGFHDAHTIEANGEKHFCSKNCLELFLFQDKPKSPNQ